MFLRRLFKISAFVSLAWVALSASSTPQILDTLRIDGSKLEVYGVPLDQLYSKVELKERMKKVLFCTASYRGYQAAWELRDSRLFLVSVHKNPCFNQAELVEAEALFPGKSYPIFAGWFTGELTSEVVRESELEAAEGAEETEGQKIWVEQTVFVFGNGILVDQYKDTRE